jgi:hypothetical protein
MAQQSERARGRGANDQPRNATGAPASCEDAGDATRRLEWWWSNDRRAARSGCAVRVTGRTVVKS